MMTMRSPILALPILGLAAFSLPIIASLAWGQPLPLEGIACASFRVSDLEHSRARGEVNGASSAENGLERHVGPSRDVGVRN